MLIRRAVEHEAPALSAIAMAAKAHWPYTAEQLEAWREDLTVSADLIASSPTCVAEWEGQIAGFYLLIHEGETWILEHLWVSPDRMRRGIGRALLSHALDVAARNGAAEVAIDADPYAEPFYLACGAWRVGAVAAPIEGQPDRERPQLRLATPMAKMYKEMAPWWPLLSAPEEYAEEAELYQRALVEACERPPRTLLEIGSGGGNNASHMKARFQMVLVDLSPEMLAVSRRLNPECEHVEGDMRTVRLGREFDCVFIHDAIVYMTTEADLRRAIETAFVHCKPGGAALFAPDHTRETFRTSTDCGGQDGGREGLRYLEWTWDPDPADSTYVVDYAYLLREGDGSVRVVHDRHTEGLFSRADWLRLLSEAGFEPSVVPIDHSELEPGSYEVFVARKPSSAAGSRL